MQASSRSLALAWVAAAQGALAGLPPYNPGEVDTPDALCRALLQAVWGDGSPLCTEAVRVGRGGQGLVLRVAPNWPGEAGALPASVAQLVPPALLATLPPLLALKVGVAGEPQGRLVSVPPGEADAALCAAAALRSAWRATGTLCTLGTLQLPRAREGAWRWGAGGVPPARGALPPLTLCVMELAALPPPVSLAACGHVAAVRGLLPLLHSTAPEARGMLVTGVLGQLVYALAALGAARPGARHNDLHLGNILLTAWPRSTRVVELRALSAWGGDGEGSGHPGHGEDPQRRGDDAKSARFQGGGPRKAVRGGLGGQGSHGGTPLRAAWRFTPAQCPVRVVLADWDTATWTADGARGGRGGRASDAPRRGRESLAWCTGVGALPCPVYDLWLALHWLDAACAPACATVREARSQMLPVQLYERVLAYPRGGGSQPGADGRLRWVWQLGGLQAALREAGLAPPAATPGGPRSDADCALHPPGALAQAAVDAVAHALPPAQCLHLPWAAPLLHNAVAERAAAGAPRRAVLSVQAWRPAGYPAQWGSAALRQSDALATAQVGLRAAQCPVLRPPNRATGGPELKPPLAHCSTLGGRRRGRDEAVAVPWRAQDAPLPPPHTVEAGGGAGEGQRLQPTQCYVLPSATVPTPVTVPL